MDIRFSRHAIRRMTLYDLKEADVVSIVTENKCEGEIESDLLSRIIR
jgi:hypothetical protein